MSSDDPVESVATGAVKGLIEVSINKIREIIKKFNEKEVSFIKEKTILEVVREQYASGESKFYAKYILDKPLLLLVRLGLTLRRLEKDKERLEDLKQKLLRKYEVNGLHIAYFVQNGILNRYTGILIEGISSEDELKEKIGRILNNIEKHSLFVSSSDSIQTVVKRALSITSAHSPSIFIVSGVGFASKVVRDSSDKLANLLNEYELERVSGGNKEILFFKRKIVNERIK